jgi:NAD-dependent dihydropyrimidine dehydrogenase PreA subunit
VKSGTWPPWFPIVDYDRCAGCRQCLDFCLFGVYALTAEGRVAVVNPENCKNLCPACARACPEVAIVFPKYTAGPLSGGEGSDIGEAAREGPKADLSSLVKLDVYSLLRERRHKARFSLGDEEEKAREERRRRASLSALRERLDIPPEVIASLSAEEIPRTCSCARGGKPASDVDSPPGEDAAPERSPASPPPPCRTDRGGRTEEGHRGD